tara:strand:- start:113 stop:271 length:159 start_codon:yes stop_codon:yes gene_type:complete
LKEYHTYVLEVSAERKEEIVQRLKEKDHNLRARKSIQNIELEVNYRKNLILS